MKQSYKSFSTISWINLAAMRVLSITNALLFTLPCLFSFFCLMVLKIGFDYGFYMKVLYKDESLYIYIYIYYVVTSLISIIFGQSLLYQAEFQYIIVCHN